MSETHTAANRMKEPNCELSEYQFGFRRGMSCLTAIGMVKNYIKIGRQNSYHTMAVSLDVANASNCLPGEVIVRALRNKNIPEYLIRILANYLMDRKLIWISDTARCIRRPVSRGVAQGSVLGPLLWNIGYDNILRTDIPDGGLVMGYADDTLLMASNKSIENTKSIMRIMYGIISNNKLRNIGLTLAEAKTEAIWAPREGFFFHGWICCTSQRRGIRCSERIHEVPRNSSRQRPKIFFEHIRNRAVKTRNMVNGLKGILQNIKGPGENKRRPYVNAVHSFMLYGCPRTGTKGT